MGEVRLDAAQVRSLTRRVLDGAAVIDGINWSTAASDELAGSAVEGATVAARVEERTAGIATEMRAWAAAALSAANGLEEADQHGAGLLGGPS
jgi:hypothetical protein